MIRDLACGFLESFERRVRTMDRIRSHTREFKKRYKKACFLYALGKGDRDDYKKGG